VRVWAGPHAVRVRVRILAGRRLDALDHGVDALAALLGKQHRQGAEPTRVRRTMTDCDGRAATAQTPAVDLVHRVFGRVAFLDGHPRVHAEVTAPTHRAGGVHLDDRFLVLGGIRRQAGRRAARRAPVAYGPRFE